jgi:hypothetical protein
MSQAARACGGLLALALLTGCASLPSKEVSAGAESVEAEGWAPVDPKDEAGTRQRALAEAQKKAVEKVTGVFLAASTKVDAAVTVRQRILADVKGYIRSYEVLGEKVEAGFHKTRIRALVARRKAGEEDPDMKALTAEPPPGSPKVSVSILGSGPQAVAWGASAASAVRSKLQERGFQMAEAAPVDAKSLLVRGEAQVYEVKDPHLGEFQSYRAKVTLEALEPGTGAVIWRQSQEASALGVDRVSASAQAIENAGALIGLAAADGLSAYLWKRF